MVYGSETWALKEAHMELLSVGNTNVIPRSLTQTGVSDIMDIIKKGIHGWAGHIV